MIHNRTIGHLSTEKCCRPPRDHSLQISINGAPTILGLASWHITGHWDYCDSELNYQAQFYVKMPLTTSSLCPTDQRPQSVNTFRPCIMEYQGAMRLLRSTIELSVAFLGKNAYDNIVAMSHNEWQRSINNFGPCIMHNLTAMERS